MDFKSEHNLSFESRPYPQLIIDGKDWQQFRIGTCEGLWCAEKETYTIY